MGFVFPCNPKKRIYLIPGIACQAMPMSLEKIMKPSLMTNTGYSGSSAFKVDCSHADTDSRP